MLLDCCTWIAFCSPQELQQAFLSMTSDWKVEAPARLELTTKPYKRTRMDEAMRAVVAILDTITGWHFSVSLKVVGGAQSKIGMILLCSFSFATLGILCQMSFFKKSWWRMTACLISSPVPDTNPCFRAIFRLSCYTMFCFVHKCCWWWTAPLIFCFPRQAAWSAQNSIELHNAFSPLCVCKCFL